MTTRARLYLCIVATIVAAVVFLAITFVDYFQQGEFFNFMQGFSGGIGFGALLGVITYAVKLKQEKQEQTAIFNPLKF